MHFFDKGAGCYVERGKEADFLNDFFFNIVGNLNIAPSDELCHGVYDKPNQFCIFDDMPTVPEVLKL